MMITKKQLFLLIGLSLGQPMFCLADPDLQWLIDEQLVEESDRQTPTELGEKVVLYATKKAEEVM